MFDHVPPPVPPAGTTNEFVDGLPIGRLPGGPARWPSQNQAVSLAAAEASFPPPQQEVLATPPQSPGRYTSRSPNSKNRSKSFGRTDRCFALRPSGQFTL